VKQTRMYVRSDKLERWIRAAAGEAQRVWFEDRWEDYEAAVLELWRLAEASGRPDPGVGILYPPYVTQEYAERRARKERGQ
jgi:hypothetical protein